MTPEQIAALARDIDFAIDVTEPQHVRLARFEDAIRAALAPPQPAADAEYELMKQISPKAIAALHASAPAAPVDTKQHECLGTCNPYVALCGATFCTEEEKRYHNFHECPQRSAAPVAPARPPQE